MSLVSLALWGKPWQTEARFLVSDYSISGGRYDNPMPESTIYPQSGTKNSAAVAAWAGWGSQAIAQDCQQQSVQGNAAQFSPLGQSKYGFRCLMAGISARFKSFCKCFYFISYV